MTQTTRTKLAEVIAEMLVENTGRHMLDSGGSNGRMWQRNQQGAGDDPVAYFESLPESHFHWPCVYPHPNFRTADTIADGLGRAELNITHNVFHWLTGEGLADYNTDMDEAFFAFAATREDDGWLPIMEDFPHHWAELRAIEELVAEFPSPQWTEDAILEFYKRPAGIYGDGDPFIVNTYNGEDALSQTLQYLWFEWDGEAYVLLQIHGGADVRGGYTAPRAFDAGDDGIAILDNARGGCGCTKCEARWYTDDAGSHWYADDDCPELHELPAREGTQVDAAFLNATSGVLVGDELPSIIIEQRGQYASDDTIVWCPICGEGILEPYPY